MNKIFIIIKREYLSRVKKKSFLVLTFLTPILIAALYAFMFWMMMRDDTEKRTIGVVNESELVNPVKSNEYTTFSYLKNTTFDKAKQQLETNNYYAILFIPKDIMVEHRAELFSHKQVTIEVKSDAESQIREHIERIKRDKIIAETNVPDLEKRLAATRTPIYIGTKKISEEGEVRESSTEIAMGIGFFAAFIIYFFIFMYGVQVMRGVIEEKSNRIVEVIISSVKPFQLMIGKIVGVAMVGLTQFLLWVILTVVLISVASSILLPGVDMDTLQQASSVADLPQGMADMNKGQFDMLQSVLNTFDLGYVIGLLASFVFYFLGGYLLYSALFAAVGSAVDNETETQQTAIYVAYNHSFDYCIVYWFCGGEKSRKFVGNVELYNSVYIANCNVGTNTIWSAHWRIIFIYGTVGSYLFVDNMDCRKNLPHRNFNVR